MCRLLAYAAPRPVAVESLIGADQCVSYRLMARLHDDGWGTAWTTDGRADGEPGEVRGVRTVRPGYDDDQLAALMDRPWARARLLHLRLATDTLAVTEVNSHPFLADGLAFAHNGSIAPMDDLRAMVGPAVMADVLGTTDSELYFALIRQELAAAGEKADGDLAAAVSRAAGAIRRAYPVASLNAVLLSPTHLVVVHSSGAAPVPWHHFGALSAEHLPAGHDHGYYALRSRILADGSYVVASAGLDTGGWDDVPQDSVVIIELASLSVRTHSLTGAGVR